MCSLVVLSAADWPTYLSDGARDGASSESIVSTSSAAQLAAAWTYHTGGVVEPSAAVVGGVAYVGAWDGYEYALDAYTGTLKWRTFLGQTQDSSCSPPNLGISSAAAVLNGVVYVGGGDANWYALSTTTGAQLWHVFTGDNSSTGGHYNWSSPLIYNGHAYIGISSNCDSPLVQGQLLEVDLSSHAVVNTLNFVPDGQVGGGVWTSPAVDPATNTIYVTTGTIATSTQQYSEAIVAVDASALTIKDSWQVPLSERTNDSDWGTTPVLFDDANGRHLVSAINKNGYVYAWDRQNLAAGYVWRTQIAQGGACPTCGDGSVSSGAFGNGLLFAAGGHTTINGAAYNGSVRALNPATGAVVWAHGSPAVVVAAIAYDNGVIIDGAGSTLELVNAGNGAGIITKTAGGTIYGAPSVSGGRIYAGSTDGNLYAFAVPGALQPSGCAAGTWCSDIGNPSLAGGQSYTTGAWTITGGGSDVWGTSDQLHFVWQPMGTTVSEGTRITSQSNSNAWAKAGVMLRATSDAASPFYDAAVTPGNGIVVDYRPSSAANAVQLTQLTGTVPAYLAVSRSGSTFTAYTSADGSTWKAVSGSGVTISSMGSSTLAGLMVTSHNTSSSSTAVFNPVNLTSTAQPAALNPPSGCPSGWSCADVGGAKPAGGESLNNGTWTVTGGGGDIWGTADQFHFVWQTLSSTGSVEARVASQSNSSSWAKAGVMLRASSAAGSPFYYAAVTPGNGIVVQYRSSSGGSAVMETSMPGTAPHYIAVGFSGSTFKAYTSSDGTSWTLIHASDVTISMGSSLLAGLAVTSHTTSVSSTATLDGVDVDPAAQPRDATCPANWFCGDVGNPTPVGSQSLSGSTLTIAGAGSDIWSTADHFHFIWHDLSGDGTLTARVATEANTNAWAKAGVMMRASTNPGAPEYSVMVTPGNGVTVQWRTATAATSVNVDVPGKAVPAYLRIRRTGTTFSAYTSSDGNTWTLVSGSSVNLGNLSGTLLEGIAVTSHADGTLCTSTLDTISS